MLWWRKVLWSLAQRRHRWVYLTLKLCFYQLRFLRLVCCKRWEIARSLSGIVFDAFLQLLWSIFSISSQLRVLVNPVWYRQVHPSTRLETVVLKLIVSSVWLCLTTSFRDCRRNTFGGYFLSGLYWRPYLITSAWILSTATEPILKEQMDHFNKMMTFPLNLLRRRILFWGIDFLLKL